MTYIRFIAGEDVDDVYWSTGIVCNAKWMIEQGMFDEWARDRVRQIFGWLNDNLPCPPFSEKRKSEEWSQDAVSWFKDSAGEPIKLVQEMWDILRTHGYRGRMIRTHDPGTIVYEDEFQIVAEIPKWIKAR